MQLIINLPNREEVLARNRQRWAEMVADSRWHDCQERIETNAFGNILMSPPPGGPHCQRSFRIGVLLEQMLGGKGFGECPLSTIDGVRACDAAWYSNDRYELIRDQLVYEVAPEICVEVVSLSNTPAELQYKRDLYFEAGAIECWQCDLAGLMSYYRDQEPDTPHPQSTFCPDFPNTISD